MSSILIIKANDNPEIISPLMAMVSSDLKSRDKEIDCHEVSVGTVWDIPASILTTSNYYDHHVVLVLGCVIADRDDRRRNAMYKSCLNAISEIIVCEEKAVSVGIIIASSMKEAKKELDSIAHEMVESCYNMVKLRRELSVMEDDVSFFDDDYYKN